MKVVITTHVFTTGPGQDLRDYLVDKKIDELLFIGHPLFYSNYVDGSSYYIYRHGKLVDSHIKKNYNIPLLIKFTQSLFVSLTWGLSYVKNYDLYVGCNNLNTLTGLLLKKLGRVKKVIYYVIDYNPNRFSNKFINFLYHKSDQFCVKYADETWNLSPRMAEGRKEYFGFSGGNQKVVPIGIWFDRIKRRSFGEIEKHTAVFMGHILEKQGVQHVIKAIPAITKIIPDFKFEILGDGPYKKELEDLTKSLGLEKQVHFGGYIENPAELENMVAKYAVAFALYNKTEPDGTLSFTYFADPGKVKFFLACGLPVLISDVPYNAYDLESKKCGFVISSDSDDIAKTVSKLMLDDETLKMYRTNAENYAREFNWKYIFNNLMETYER